ncbi:hypothetical protein NKH77_39265 [Streptomyces sp. M19]
MKRVSALSRPRRGPTSSSSAWTPRTRVRGGHVRGRLPHGDRTRRADHRQRTGRRPRTGTRELRTAAYLHGTNESKKGAATVDAHSGDRGVTIAFAGAGFATVAPTTSVSGSARPPPYMQHGAETTASLDLLRAAREVVADRRHTLAPRVHVAGFSQGGPGAMALGRALQSGGGWPRSPHERAVRRRGRGDAGGAARFVPRPQVGDVLPGVLAHRDEPPLPLRRITVVGLPLAVRRHGGRALRREPHLRAGAGRTARYPEKLLKEDFVHRVDHPSGALLRAFRDNDDTCDWKPAVPVRVYAAHGDRSVTHLNSQQCLLALKTRGTRTSR